MIQKLNNGTIPTIVFCCFDNLFAITIYVAAVDTFE